MDITTLELEDDLEILEEDASSQFNFSFEIDRAEQIFSSLQASEELISGSFYDNQWKIRDNRNLQKGHTNSFDFSRLEPFALQSGLKFDLILIAKCWVCSLLEIHPGNSVQTNYTKLIQALQLSHGFDIGFKETFKENLEEITSERVRYAVTMTALNFIDYTQIDDFLKLVPTLQEVKSITSNASFIRTLPPSKNVLQFSYIFDDFFAKLTNLSKIRNAGAKVFNYNLIILFYPLLIWWKLTNIIPMRTSEFCLIARDCIKPVGNKFYITLPRTKLKPKKKRDPRSVQAYDKVVIDQEIYNLISKYITLTDKFGETKTLIHFRAIASTDEELLHGPYFGWNRLNKKLDHDYFSLCALSSLIQRFYDDVIGGIYNITVDKEKRIRPGDTRHFAFINMMMQGVPPVEIARIGVHSTIGAHYLYSAHVEYWIDSTVDKLLEKSKLNINERGLGFYYIPDELTELTLKPGTCPGVKKPLELGYCSDKDQRCETDILGVSGCMFGCSHWRIESKELIEKKEFIVKLIMTKKKKIHELYGFLASLHRQILSKEYQNKIPTLLTELTTTSKLIDHEIRDFASFKGNPLGGGVILSA